MNPEDKSQRMVLGTRLQMPRNGKKGVITELQQRVFGRHALWDGLLNVVVKDNGNDYQGKHWFDPYADGQVRLDCPACRLRLGLLP